MTDCVIIGGGIIGMLTARELSIGGASVTLLEKGETARESSWAGGGILSPLYPWRYPDAVTLLARHSQEHYADVTGELHADTGIDPEFIRSGLMIFNQEELDAGLSWAARWNQNVEAVDAAVASGLEPELAAPEPRALWFPDVAQVRNPRFTRALRADIERRGVVIRTQTPVTALTFAGNHVTGVETPRGKITADRIVVCAGAWTGELLGRGAGSLDIEPVRGQMILFHGTPGLVRHITLFEGRYAIPRRDGRVLFGSTIEHAGFDKKTTAHAREDLYAHAVALLPALRRLPIEHHWAGLRPGAPQGVPYIGVHPRAENLFVNAGHFRNGVVLGLASARLGADLVLGRDPILDPAPYAIDAAR